MEKLHAEAKLGPNEVLANIREDKRILVYIIYCKHRLTISADVYQLGGNLSPRSSSTEEGSTKLKKPSWSSLFAPRDGSAENVTDRIVESAKVLFAIFNGDEELLAAGKKFDEEERELNERSLIGFYRTESGHVVLVRHADAFVNHLYTTPWGTVASVVVSLRDDFGTITVSKENADIPINCRDLVQAVWGPEAGGHDGIAGSPRGQKMTMDDLDACVEEVLTQFGGKKRLCCCGSKEKQF